MTRTITARAVMLSALALVALACSVAFWPATASAPLDLWRGEALLRSHHLFRSLGAETFAAVGNPSGYAGWLSFVLDARLHDAGANVAALFAGLAFTAALVLVTRRTRALNGSPAAACGVGAVFALATLGSARDPIACLNLALVALAVALLERLRSPGRWELPAIIALTAFWANLDAWALLVPGLAVLLALGAAIDAREFSQTAKTFALGAVATLAATLATPFGIDLPLRASEHLALGADLGGFVTWQPGTLDPSAYWSALVPLLLVAAAFGLGRRGDAGGTMLVIGAALCALANGHFVAASIVVAAPIVGARLAGMRADANAPGRLPTLAATSVVAALVVVAAGVFPAFSRAGVLVPMLTSDVVTPLFDGHDHRVACAPLSLCDPLVARNDAKIRVLMDSRVTAYPAAVEADQTKIAGLKTGWRRLVDTDKIDALEVRAGSALDDVLALSPQWRRHGIQSAALYERVH